VAFTLPDAIWKYVCLFLPTVCIFSQVCKSFKIVIDNTWKQLIKRDFSIGYDIYNIESQFTHVDFKKTYRILKTQCVSSKFDLPNSKNAKVNCEELLILIGRSKQQYCALFLDNLFHIYKESNCPILFTKIQKFIDLFQSYKLKDYLSLYIIGFLLHHVFGKKEEALQYYTMAIPLNIKCSFECVIEMIQCINDPEKLKSMCESYFTVFPTRTYIILFAWAHRLRADNEPHIVLPMALRSLEEYDKRQPDNLVIKSNQDAPIGYFKFNRFFVWRKTRSFNLLQANTK
jgi:hypothetical protein